MGSSLSCVSSNNDFAEMSRKDIDKTSINGKRSGQGLLTSAGNRRTLARGNTRGQESISSQGRKFVSEFGKNHLQKTGKSAYNAPPTKGIQYQPIIKSYPTTQYLAIATSSLQRSKPTYTSTLTVNITNETCCKIGCSYLGLVQLPCKHKLCLMCYRQFRRSATCKSSDNIRRSVELYCPHCDLQCQISLIRLITYSEGNAFKICCSLEKCNNPLKTEKFKLKCKHPVCVDCFGKEQSNSSFCNLCGHRVDRELENSEFDCKTTPPPVKPKDEPTKPRTERKSKPSDSQEKIKESDRSIPSVAKSDTLSKSGTDVGEKTQTSRVRAEDHDKKKKKEHEFQYDPKNYTDCGSAQMKEEKCNIPTGNTDASISRQKKTDSENNEDTSPTRHICEDWSEDGAAVTFGECGHSVCYGCLTKIIEENKNENLLRCPHCHTKTHKINITEKGISVFQLHYRQMPRAEKSKPRADYTVYDIKGIPNIGMTCYANCIFQVLAQTPNLLNTLKISASYLHESGKTITLTGLLYRILHSINEKDGRIVVSSDVNYLMTMMFKLDTSFSRYEQNDCHSFIMSLFNAIKEESQQFTNLNEFVTIRHTIDGLLKSSDQSYNPIQMFEGALSNRFTYSSCDCQESSDDQMFVSLLIPVRTEQSILDKWTIEHGIDILLERETFAHNVLPCRKCERTGNSDSDTETTKTLEIVRTPDVLILQLGRFREVPYYENRKFLAKSHCHVGYPTTLDVKESDGKTKSSTQKYQLYAVVLHVGSLHGGHYYSYVKSNDKGSNAWFYCSDSSVFRMDEKDIVQETGAYLLFYHRYQGKQ